MPPLPGDGEIYFWRLVSDHRKATWQEGIGAELAGGRWNTKGVRAVYGAADAATAILEVAVHTGFAALDEVPHTLFLARILSPLFVHRVDPESVPNPHWLHPGTPSLGQQRFGNALLAVHPVIMVPSVCSLRSWNLILNPEVPSEGVYEVLSEEPFALDPRLNPPPP